MSRRVDKGVSMFKGVLLSLYIAASLIGGFIFSDTLGSDNAWLGSLIGFCLGSFAYFVAFKP
ncbi:MAG: hypothetical protein V7749_00615, partial [Cocleimonas sp.]